MIYNLFDFTDRTAGEFKNTFVTFPYMKVLCKWVEKCVSGTLPEGKRDLIITIPPRHYKTTFVSQSFPAWALAELSPDCEFILTSATSGLATKNSMAVKKIVNSEWYQDLYPHVRIAKDGQDVQHFFTTTCGGSLYASGLGGTITGFGAGKVRKGFGGAIIIDDPLKAIEAYSETMRQKCIDYYTGTLKSRRNSIDNTPMILIMQRLHTEDLVGWILKNEPNTWYHVNFPALSEDMRLLNPNTTTVEELLTLKEVDPENFYAQYQQNPTISGGSIIRPSWWKLYDPETHNKSGLVFLTADTAFKAEKKHDRSVIRVWEGTYDNLYCLDALYGRWEFPELLANSMMMWTKWREKGAKEFYIEDKASGTPLVQSLEDAGVPAEGWKPGDYEFPDDKVARMKASSFNIHGGRVHLPKGDILYVDENKSEMYVSKDSYELIEEARLFAKDMSHAHDDHCDTMTMAVSIWKSLGGGIKGGRQDEKV